MCSIADIWKIWSTADSSWLSLFANPLVALCQRWKVSSLFQTVFKNLPTIFLGRIRYLRCLLFLHLQCCHPDQFLPHRHWFNTQSAARRLEITELNNIVGKLLVHYMEWKLAERLATTSFIVQSIAQLNRIAESWQPFLTPEQITIFEDLLPCVHTGSCIVFVILEGKPPRESRCSRL